MKLQAQYIEKPWGRIELPSAFSSNSGRPIGEICFGADATLPLLVKYLFTSEKLSIQVHPDDQQAGLRGMARGKSECWYVLDADPGASIGLGLRREFTRDQLRSAALDGSVVEALHWRPVEAGDFLYVPAGTIHSIGGGISLLEFQQNSDVTYRLYDYGRPRELHVEDAVAVADLTVETERLFQRIDEGQDGTLVDGPHFTVVHAHSDRLADRRRWILPLEGTVRCNGDRASAGECLLLNPGDELQVDEARLLIGASC